jgi:hypothetical protein
MKIKHPPSLPSAHIDLTGDDDKWDGKRTKITLKTLKKKAAKKQKHTRKRPISLIIDRSVTEKKNMNMAFSQNSDYFGDATFVQNLQDPNTNACEPGTWFTGDAIDIFLKTTHGMLGNPEVINSSENYSLHFLHFFFVGSCHGGNGFSLHP